MTIGWYTLIRPTMATDKNDTAPVPAEVAKEGQEKEQLPVDPRSDEVLIRRRAALVQAKENAWAQFHGFTGAIQAIDEILASGKSG